jgi:hypothetical protein
LGRAERKQLLGSATAQLETIFCLARPKSLWETRLEMLLASLLHIQQVMLLN